VTSQPRGAAAEKSPRKASGQHIPPTAKIPLSDIVVLVQMVDPSLDLVADFRQTRHGLRRREFNEFLRLGRRIAHANEIALEDLFPALTAAGSFGRNGFARRLTPVRAVRRCGFASQGAVS
jgi:hypothetical protein